MRRKGLLQLFFILQALLRFSVDAGPLEAAILCGRIPGLTEKQRELCRRSPESVAAVGEGVRLGLLECQQLFQDQRWNCSDIGWPAVFTHVVVVASKEAAFTYAVSSAGVTYAVTSACSRGDISSCGCEPERQVRRQAGSRGWKWGGCSADVRFGMRFARKFLDARELEGDARSLMNLHNNKAGRKAVKATLQMQCKCHGVSGSCSLKTCWETLPSFREVGDTLFRKYNRARPVVALPSGVSPRATLQTSPRPAKLVLRRTRSSDSEPPPRTLPKRSDLVFLQMSPNYCERDLFAGSLGTGGRQCNRTSRGTDGCDLMCCGRGYDTQQSVRSWRCNCKFQWCCSVSCDICSENIEQYTCK